MPLDSNGAIKLIVPYELPDQAREKPTCCLSTKMALFRPQGATAGCRSPAVA